MSCLDCVIGRLDTHAPCLEYVSLAMIDQSCAVTLGGAVKCSEYSQLQ